MLRAAERGHDVKAAIADVDFIAKDAAKNTAMHLAAYRGHSAVVELMSLSNKLCLRTRPVRTCHEHASVLLRCRSRGLAARWRAEPAIQ
jgi:ankyrin repeat protein